MSDKVKESIRAGQNVIAKISGKEVTIYCAQIADGKATLQGAQQHIVPVEDCKPA